MLVGSDLDETEIRTLKFRLVTSTSSFRIDQFTGEVTTTHALDREKQTNHELTVLLSDEGKPPLTATATVLIQITDENDHDPIVVFPANGKGNISVSYREPPGEVSECNPANNKLTRGLLFIQKVVAYNSGTCL